MVPNLNDTLPLPNYDVIGPVLTDQLALFNKDHQTSKRDMNFGSIIVTTELVAAKALPDQSISKPSAHIKIARSSNEVNFTKLATSSKIIKEIVSNVFKGDQNGFIIQYNML